MRRHTPTKCLAILMCALVVAVASVLVTPMRALAESSGTWGGCTWTLSDAGVLDIAPTNGTSGKLADFTQATAPWAGRGFTSVKVEQGVVAADNMSFAFADSDKCTSFDLTGLSMSTCTSMYEMFSGCSAVESLDLSSLDTSNVTNMEATFQDCSKLSSLNLTGSFTTSGVTSMASMFTHDSSLPTIDLSHFDTQKTENMNGMFLGCAALTSLDLSGFDTTFTQTMYSIFSGCDSLATLKVGAAFSFVGGVECELPSPGFSHATGYWISTYSGQYLSADQIENGYSLFADTYTAEYDNHGICGGCTWTCENDVLDIKPTDGVSGTLDNLYSPTALPSSSYCRKNLTPWGHATYTSVKIEPGVIANERFSGAFFRDPSDIHKPSLTSVDISNLDTTNTIKAECVFFGNNNLTTIDMANKFANASSTYGMFDTCNSLETISNLTTPATTDTGYMFYDCSKLTSIDLPKVVTSNASYMECMFKGCSGLTSLDFSDCNAFAPISTSGLFSDCTSLATLDLTKLSSTNCNENQDMFSGCTALTKVTIGDGFSFNASYQGQATTTCTLPTPAFAGATGKWFSWNDGLAYTPDQITTADKKVADTFTAQTTGNDIALAKVAGIEKSYVYSGSQIKPVPTITWTDGTTLIAGTDYEITYGDNVNAGSGVGTLSISGKGNYTGSTALTFDIAKAPSSQNAVTVSAYSGVYDAQAHGITVGEPAKSSSTILYSTDGEKWSGVAPTWTDVTIAQSVVVKVTNTNYEDFTTSATVTISARPVTVTANDKTKAYGEADPTLDAKVEGTLGSDMLIYSVARAKGEDVGEYVVTPTGDAAQGNYAVAYKSGKLTITKAAGDGNSVTVSAYLGVYDAQAHGITVGEPAKTGSTVLYSTDGTNWLGTAPTWTDVTTAQTVHVKVTNPNYADFMATATVTISARPVTVTANDNTKVYGEADPAFDAKVEGTLGSDKLIYSVARATGEDVGSYPITPAGDAAQGNYAVTYKSGTLSITKAPASANAVTATGYEGTYDAGPHAVSATSAVSNGTTISYSTDGGATWSAAAPSFTDVCDVTVQVKAENKNYEDATGSAKVTIDPRSITVSAPSEEFTYDGQPHTAATCTVTAGGLAGTDDISATATGTITNVAESPVRNVVGDVTFTSGKESNYKVTKADGSLTMKKAAADKNPVTATGYTGTFDGFAHGAAATAAADGSTVEYSSDGTTWQPSSPTQTNAGTLTVHVRATNPNYEDATADATIELSQANIANATIYYLGDHIYDANTYTPTPTLTLGVKGHEYTLTGDDFTVSYGRDEYDNVKPLELGKYTYLAEGTGNFRGTLSAHFKIVSAPGVDRLSGNVALDTMGAIVEKAFPAQKSAGTVVLCTQGGYWDALAASGVAGLADAPVLITDGKTLSTQTREQIARLTPSKVIVVGGTAAVSDAVANDAAKAGTWDCKVVRLSGENAVGTAVDVFNKGVGAVGGDVSWGDTAFVATNETYQDALSVSPYAYAEGDPIFLTSGSSSISDETLAAIKRGGFKHVVIVGGPAAIAPSVADSVSAAAGITCERLWGQSAVETSLAVAGWECDNGFQPDSLAVTTSNGYWDALCGASLCGKNHAVVLLADSDSGNMEALNGFVTAHKSTIARVFVLGGTSAVSQETIDHIQSLLG